MTTTTPQEPRLVDTIGRDLSSVSSEVMERGLGPTVRRSLADLEEFYLTPERQRRLAGMGKVRRWLSFTAWLLRSLFLKLAPSRRVLMLLAVVAVWASFQGVPGNRAGAYAASVLLLLVLALELKDKLLAREELEAGRAVQRALMPEAAPDIPGWDVWLFTRPANDVGGDLVDWIPLAGGRVGVALADVAGKGLPAALLMAKVQATLRALAPDCETLDALARRTNAILHRDTPRTSFVTLLYMELPPDARRVRLLNAGHMPPLVLRAGGLEELSRGCSALSLSTGTAFREEGLELAVGDLLVVYSDGITDAQDEAGEFFGLERLKAEIRPLAGLSAAEAGELLVGSVARFVGRARAFDDLSLVVVRRRS